MSGHSKWATTKHKKAAIDAKRSSLFSKLSRNITVAAKLGGDPNPDNNATLAAAVQRARMVSMPNAKIKAAIDKAFGAGADAATYEEITYEGYGPAGIAVYVDCLTDNKNRTAADVRSAFTHAGGNLGTTGSVAFQFERKGSIAVDKVIKSDDMKVPDRENAVDEDEFMMAVAEADGEDYEDAGDEWIVYTAYDKMQDVQKGLEAQGIEVKGSELTMVATTPTDVSVADAKKVQRLVDRLEELEDVQNVYDTMNRTDEIEAALDETNVARFAAYIKRYSLGTQFILITHRRGTMEAANRLYGVTMPERGISKVLTLDVRSISGKQEGDDWNGLFG